MIKIIDAKLPPARGKHNKKRKNLYEAVALMADEQTIVYIPDSETVARFAENLREIAEWLIAKYVHQKQGEAITEDVCLMMGEYEDAGYSLNDGAIFDFIAVLEEILNWMRLSCAYNVQKRKPDGHTGT